MNEPGELHGNGDLVADGSGLYVHCQDLFKIYKRAPGAWVNPP